METSSELNDDSQKLRAGLQRFSRRGLVAVQCGQGAERKTGWLHGGHYPLGAAHCEMLVQCTSPCCAGRPLALHPEGCLFNGSGFERHAGYERHKKWSESIRVLAPEECAAPAPAGDDAHIKPEQPAPDPPATPASAAAAAARAASTANVGMSQATGAGGSCGGGEEQGGDGAIADPARAAARALWPASAGITLRLFLCNVSRLLEAQHGLTGRPIWVFWLAENRWFKGKVESFRVKLGSNRSGRARVNWSHTVRYDDGDVEELHLGLELFSLQRPPGWQPDPQSPLAGQEQQAAAGAEGEAEQAAAEGGQAAEEEEEGGRGEDASAPDRRGRRCATAPGSVPAPCGNKRRRESPPVGSPVAGQERRDAAEGQQEQRRILQEGSPATPSQQADGNAQQPASREGQPQPMEQDGRQEQQPEQCQDEQWAQTQEQPGATPAQPGGQPAAVEQPGPAQLPALAPATANLEHLTRTLLAGARQPGTADAGLSPVLVWQFLLAWRRMAQSERQDYASMAVEAARHGSPEALTELLRSGLAAA